MKFHIFSLAEMATNYVRNLSSAIWVASVLNHKEIGIQHEGVVDVLIRMMFIGSQSRLGGQPEST